LPALSNEAQRPPREISNPLISTVQILLKALNESLLFTWRLDIRGDYVPKLVALAGVDIFSQLLVELGLKAKQR
jgi:hypothetical protein